MKKAVSLALLLSLASPVLAVETMPTQQAQVTAQDATPITEDKAIDMVKIEKSPIFLSSHIAKRFNAYKVTVVNNYPGNLELTSASIENGVPGSIAASGTATSYINVLWGLPLFWLGMGIAAGVIAGKNHKAETESFQFTNQIPTSTLHKNENLTFNALVPIGQTPQIRLRFDDKKAGLSFAKTSI